ncbi:hypothetical protein FRC16_005490 [Serendipita sp. 398]|nr:hypothetical protein FRC16_005490 [Serendipita sp. 398]
MILLGMFSSGVACLAAGRGTLRFTQPTPVEGSPPGDGVLHSANEFLILLGSEGSVGAFSLKLGGEPQNHIIGFSALLLVVQFLLQLLLIPQGTLFGQAMFLATFACSWMYNCYLSSIDKEEVQRDILMSNILRMKPQDLKKYEFTKRTTAVIFLLWILQPSDKEMLLDELLPNNTATWKAWKKDVLEQLGSNALPKSPPNVQKEENLLKSLHTLSDLAHTMYWNYKQSHNTAVMDPTNAQNA